MLGIILIIIQYLFSPVVFLLTFILPIVFFFVNRKYVWCSILLTVVIELIINWGNFMYYESRGLISMATAAQIAVMAVIILILKAVAKKGNR